MQGFEGMDLSDALRLTLTTVTTVGYGDLSAATPAGRAAPVVRRYVVGIFALAKIAGYFDYRAARRLRKLRGEWDWNMHGHILITNMPARDGEQYFVRPLRACPGMIVLGIVAPGSEQIIENMFSSSSDEYRRFDVAVSNVDGKDVECRVIGHDLGTAVAYISATDGVLNGNPPANTRVYAKALILTVRENNKPTLTRVERALQTGA